MRDTWDEASLRVMKLMPSRFDPEMVRAEIIDAILMERERVLKAANAYLKEQYGICPLEHPTDRARIDATLAGTR